MLPSFTILNEYPALRLTLECNVFNSEAQKFANPNTASVQTRKQELEFWRKDFLKTAPFLISKNLFGLFLLLSCLESAKVRLVKDWL